MVFVTPYAHMLSKGIWLHYDCSRSDMTANAHLVCLFRTCVRHKSPMFVSSPSSTNCHVTIPHYISNIGKREDCSLCRFGSLAHQNYCIFSCYAPTTVFSSTICRQLHCMYSHEFHKQLKRQSQHLYKLPGDFIARAGIALLDAASVNHV